MNYDFVEEQKRFYHLAKSINFSAIKDPEVKKILEKLLHMIHILKDLKESKDVTTRTHATKCNEE